MILFLPQYFVLLVEQAEAKVMNLKSELANTKQQLDNQQAERNRISWVATSGYLVSAHQLDAS